MGLRLFGSSSSYDSDFNQPLPNPDPSNFKILTYMQYDSGYIILLVQYLDCTNYEGKKIMVYESTYKEIIEQKSLDPHFSENKTKISPIARFEPTDKGWSMANRFVKSLQ